MKANLIGIVLVGAALTCAGPLWGQNSNNAVEVALLRWYPANLVTQFATCGGTNGYGLTFDGSHMWVACSGQNQLQEFDSSDGTLLRTVAAVTTP